MNKLISTALAGVGLASAIAGCPYGVGFAVAAGVARSLWRAILARRPMHHAI